ncbi:MAG TPA: type I polyketide synthase, partial [Hyphomicrobiaceae bacterium]|nr:type I polyketide synthase [Hyphomicrobiaceae bacterium]
RPRCADREKRPSSLIVAAARSRGREGHRAQLPTLPQKNHLRAPRSWKNRARLKGRHDHALSGCSLVPTWKLLSIFPGCCRGAESILPGESSGSDMNEPIAITGVGCRFPGGADTLDSYWNLLRNGVDAITEVPGDRWDLSSLYHADPSAPGKMYTRYGAFLPRVDEFDAQFFGISPREATQMDPQQRFLLEVAWEALESAGQPPHRMAGSQTGVFLGISTNDYAAMRESSLVDIDPYTGTGSAFSVAAGRLSYVLGLHGPNVAVDTACSSALVAVHLACQSLRSGECGLALAGGVNLILTPDTTIYLCRLRALAPDGRCKTFDAAADGYARGEGCGIVVLKRLSDAMRDRDTILGVIRGSAINHDGRSNGLTAPNGAAQEAVIRAALENAGIQPDRVGFVEAHGTGTPLGDEIELQTLATTLGRRRTAQHPLIVGSVKTNFGHLEAASGVAALIKAVLAIRYGEIPPHLHFTSPNPDLPWEDLRLEVPVQLTSWPKGYAERIAGVSNFGISGTNAHIVLAEAPAAAEPAPQTEQPCLLAFSARHADALRALAQAYRSKLQQPSTHNALSDVCYTAGVRRSHYEHRVALLGSSEQEIDARLAAFLQGESSPDMWTGVSSPAEPRKVAFVFPGQGGQWAGMGRQLLESEPVFRDAIERCDRAMRPFVDWSLLGALSQDEWERIDIIQPAVFAIQTALATLWRAWGIVPDAVVGHSMGEVAAAHVAGILSLDDAARIICRRSALLRRLSGRGAMAIVELSLEEAQALLAGYQQRVSVAVSNSSRSTVLSGDVAALEEIITALERQGVFCRRVKVDVASHSPQMDVLREELLEALQGLQPQSAILPFYSTVTGMTADGRDFDAAYWVRNLRQPVLFAGTVERMAADGHDIFVEVSPHPILLPALEDNLRGLSQRAAVLPSLRREESERETMLRSLGSLYALGQPVAWNQVHAAGGRVVSLPPYPWQRERFWTPRPDRKRARRAPGAHPFLETHLEPAGQPGTHLWETALDLDAFPYLADHRLGTLAVFPAAAYAETALAAAKQVFGAKAFCLENLTFKKLLIVDEAASSTIQISFSENTRGVADMQVASRPASADAWTLNATGTIRVEEAGEPPGAVPALEEIRLRCPEHLTGADYYRALAAQGLPYGPSFTGIAEIWRRPGEVLARLEPSEIVTTQAGLYQVHPALLDMCFQAMGAALRPGADSPYLPVSLGSLRLWRQPGPELIAHARLTEEP